jgi:AcrR family transcriptional regulator
MEPASRAAQKARTRSRIRDSAHRLFDERGFDAVTVTDVARDAGVVIQTVFNHFSSKEELFFDGRSPWVDGPAAAVRDRPDGQEPLAALAGHLRDEVRSYTRGTPGPARAEFIATVESSPALRRFERHLSFVSEQRLRAALRDAWTRDGAPGGVDPEVAGAVVAGVWLAATRALMVGQLGIVEGPPDAERVAATASAIASSTLDVLARTGSPHARLVRGDGAARLSTRP